MSRPAATNGSARPAPKAPAAPAAKAGGAAAPPAPAEEASSGGDGEVAQIREKVLALLEKHDKGKVDRIDIIMDKFKGKEVLLLEKMTQRYEGAAAPSPSVSAQKRNEMAMKRHEERMRKIREAKGK